MARAPQTMSRSAVRCASSRATRPNDRSRSRSGERRLFRWFRGFAVSRGCAGSVAAGFGWCAREISRLFHSISFPHSHAREHSFALGGRDRLLPTRYRRDSSLSSLPRAEPHVHTRIYRERTHQASTADIRGLVALVCSLSCALSRSLACQPRRTRSGYCSAAASWAPSS